MVQSQNRIEELRERIEHWRKTRQKRSPMPADLWKEAADITRELGVYAVARNLRLSYDSLKKRVEARKDSGETVRPKGFVEIPGSQLVGWPETAGTVVELADGNGAMLKIRLAGGEGLDVRGLTDAFWNRRG